MISFRFTLLCLVGTLCICFCVGSSNMKQCMKAERQALLKLKDGFIDESGILSSWKGEYCCNWTGISCNNISGHVTKLDLGSTLLGGKIHSSVCQLQHLTVLDLNYNHFEGKIPECIGSLAELIELGLADNEFTSSIPHSMGNLSNLQILDLHENKFTSSIPHTLGNLSNLHTLDLSYNSLLVSNDLEWISHLSNLRYLNMSHVYALGQAIDWLSSISKLPCLVELHLDQCELSQSNPNSIPHMNSSTSLRVFSLSNNDLKSSILLWVLNASKFLTYLDLSNNEIEGRVSNPFQSFCQLKMLDLSSNKLSGQLSDYIEQLSCAQNSLEDLRLGDNPFSSGPLPDFSRLSSLKSLYLKNASIVGPLPHSIGHLLNLSLLNLNHNQLNGSLSLFNVSKLVSLEFLYLSHNQLDGTLSFAPGQLPALLDFDVSFNKLSGVINESHLSNLSQLEVLEVSHNSLSFNLSSNRDLPFSLAVLYASSCILGPKFPAWLKYQRELIGLDISNCGISDSFPKWFSNMSSNLLYLNISHNKLSGTLPKSYPIVQFSTYYVWDLSFNNLNGALPRFPPQPRSLVLSNNMFSGPLSSFCETPNLFYLAFLDLSSNLLAGGLSDCWGQFQNLQVLHLEKNNFSGKIPKSFGTLQHIEVIHLNNNNFSGAIPTLTLCSNLKLVDFGDNNLEGTMPAWVSHKLHDLIVLRLRGNKFQGSIPTSFCNLLHLQVLDLSKNNISGEIPQCLNRITALSDTTFPRENFSYVEARVYATDEIERSYFDDKARLEWKGEDREYGKNLRLMTIIDLSCNHLTGEIPDSITELVALAGLNLSTNNLTGFIPNNIGHMKMLESLDLSRNYLYGRIPASLSNLTFLSYMNLSYNNLSGKIPESTQLDTFDAFTYVGNSELCGPPIEKQCPGDESSPNRQLHGSTDQNGTVENELITFGFYVSLGLGFIVGFWGVCGTLFFKSSWRYAYFEFFNRINDWVYLQLVLFMARMKRRFQVQN